MGLVFVLDRDTGQPIFPVAEEPVPPSDVPGEQTWPTQPIPLKPPPLARQAITEADLTNITPAAHASALERVPQIPVGLDLYAPEPAGHHHDARPPGRRGVAGRLLRSAVECPLRERQRVPTINRLRPVYGLGGRGGASSAQGKQTPAQLGLQIYQARCMACHGSDREGHPPQIPALANLAL